MHEEGLGIRPRTSATEDSSASSDRGAREVVVYRQDNEPLWLIVFNTLKYQAIHCYHS
jgi:hypothetical protein